MTSQSQKSLHFILFPLMAQGHIIPMIDIAKMLAQHGMIVTVVTTPLNAKRFATTIARAAESRLQIKFIEVQFPSQEAGLPKECENFDMLPSLGLGDKVLNAANSNKVQEQVQKLLEEIQPRPSCIISDTSLYYTSHVARKLGIPRISFNGSSCFCNFCMYKINTSRVLESLTSESESEYFVVPDLPDHVEVTKNQLPWSVMDLEKVVEKVNDAEMVTYGMIMNSFEELEAAYVQQQKKARDGKVWCVGPAWLRNKAHLDRIERGNKSSVAECEYLNWLNSQKPGSVLYVCLGSICNLIYSQLIELGLGLELSNRPFIWVIRSGEYTKGIEKWIVENGYEERIKERGFLIHGWAPQVRILSHEAIGGFLTHCGWNSILEGISAGKTMVTWPLFGDQFFNEKFVVDVLRIGVKIGVEVTLKWGEEEKVGVLVKKEGIKDAIERLMHDGEESEERRKRAQELGKMAKKAVEEEGSSYLNMRLLIQDIMQQTMLSN